MFTAIAEANQQFLAPMRYDIRHSVDLISDINELYPEQITSDWMNV